MGPKIPCDKWDLSDEWDLCELFCGCGVLGVTLGVKVDRALDYFLKGNPRGLVFRRIDFNAWPSAALKLLAALSSQNN